jgi:integrase
MLLSFRDVFPYFWKWYLDSLLPMELERWRNNLLEKYKASTVQKMLSILYSILDKAVQNNLLQRNPLERVTAPKVMLNLQDEEEDADSFTESEMQIILDNSNFYKRSPYMSNFILLMYGTGMRPGEATALRWSGIDWDRKTISITKTRQRNEEGAAKTKASNRKIDLLPLEEEALKNQYELTKNHEYIFISSKKEPFYSHDIIGVNFQRILKRTGIKARVLYNLRHTFASQLISKGADIVYVSKMLGHKDVSITLKIYTKFIEEDDEIRFKKIEKMGTIMGTFQKKSL